MVRSYHGFRLVLETICSVLLFALIAIPLTIAAFTVSIYMGVPFLIVMLAGQVRQIKHNS